MLSGFRSGEDFAFIASHDCLTRRIDDESKKLEPGVTRSYQARDLLQRYGEDVHFLVGKAAAAVID